MSNVQILILSASIIAIIFSAPRYEEFVKDFTDPLPGQWRDPLFWLLVVLIFAPYAGLLYLLLAA